MDNSAIAVWVIGAVLALISIAVFMRKERKVAGFPKMGVAVILAVLAVGLFAMQGGYLGQVGLNPLSSVGVPSVDTLQLLYLQLINTQVLQQAGVTDTK